MNIVLLLQLLVAVVIALFVAYNLLHYVLFLLVTQPRDARKIGHQLNQFEERQLVEWTPQPSDFLKHDDEKRTYDDVFGTYRDEQANYSTCVFPRMAFSCPYEAEYVLLKPKDGMRLLDQGVRIRRGGRTPSQAAQYRNCVRNQFICASGYLPTEICKTWRAWTGDRRRLRQPRSSQ